MDWWGNSPPVDFKKKTNIMQSQWLAVYKKVVLFGSIAAYPPGVLSSEVHRAGDRAGLNNIHPGRYSNALHPHKFLIKLIIAHRLYWDF
jgi:hypothetical protein